MSKKEFKKQHKVRHSGHLVDQKLKPSVSLGDPNFLTTLSSETQEKIHLCPIENIRAEGIRLTPSQDKLLNALFKLLHDKSENRNTQSENFYGGNFEKEMVQYGGREQTAYSPKIRIFPSELYKSYMDNDDYSGADIKFIKRVLRDTESQKFLIIYDRKRETKNEKGKKEILTDRIEDFQSLFKIISFFEGLTEEEVQTLDQGDESLREKRGELIIALNPLLTDQINSKYVEYPSDINKRTVIAAGGHRLVTESMIALRDYMLRELSARRFQPEINEEKLFLILKLEKYLKSKRKKLIQQRTEDAIQFAKSLGLIEDYERIVGASGQWKYVFHSREDAEMMFRRVKFAYDSLPEELKTLRQVNTDNARELQFNNGSTIRIGTSMRSSTLQYLHVSEFGKISARYPDKAREIMTGSLNALAAGQYVFIESTAEGREGHFYQMCKEAQSNRDSGKKLSPLDFRFHFFPWWGHKDYRIDSQGLTVPEHLSSYFNALEGQINSRLESAQRAWYVKRAITQGEDMKREFPSTPEEAFETSNEGAYYGKQITKARIEGRIRKVYYDANVPVHTAWDLGYNDSTAIWFFQQCGQEIHLLEYYENSGEALTHYLQYLKNKPYTYGKHLVPHDAAVHEYSTGLSRVEVAKNHGVLFTITPDIGVIEGVDAARNILLRCWFDEEKCSKGIIALESYRKDWNEQLGCWASRPLHNFASHGADAFRMLAVGLGKLENKGLTAAEWRQLRAAHV